MQIPVKTGQLTVPKPAFEAAVQMRAHADKRGYEYPENYVLSEWGRNWMYNGLVNGESESYGLAYSNYDSFMRATDGEEWYETLRNRARGSSCPEDALGTRLHERYGGDDAVSGLG
ncbi:hypothetical protein [Halegenticoccus tardaugens]|uniref:hypothetical protein n=1 Tax=Halegenticoccus tardaugens TaxID=2071624 RepID=UPI00100BE4F4|nr:hypothetical protein [Halegenticoccus tardaugens]